MKFDFDEISPMGKAVGIIIICLLITGIIMMAVSNYQKNHPCIEYQDICQEAYQTIQYNVALKMMMPTTYYRDVDCHQLYDRIDTRCMKRK